jgi:putative polyhydroxyalkanoate system protein
MPKLSLQVPHSLGREEATRRIKQHAAKAAEKATDLKEQWQDHTLTFRFKAMGFGVSGNLVVEDAAVKVNVDLPLAAAMIKGMIEERLRQQFAGVLSESKPPTE